MLQQGGYENAKGERTESSVGMLKKIERRLLIEVEKCCGFVSFFLFLSDVPISRRICRFLLMSGAVGLALCRENCVL